MADRRPNHWPPRNMPSTGSGNAAPHPALLPAFEPFSSSPPSALPRPSKRKIDDVLDDRKYYPTPIPTSSTGILPSSPPPPRQTRPGLQRSVSALSERAPLADVPTLTLPSSGEPLLMGRSSNSSDYQISSNRHISRVHIRASYCHPDSFNVAGKVEVECLGWNGAKIHCRGEIVELAKGDVFVSDKPLAQIIVDVQDTRVMLVWPKGEARESVSAEARSPWAEESPSKRRNTTGAEFASSPPLYTMPPRLHSPVSPTPAVDLNSSFSSTFRADQTEEVKVYVDAGEDSEADAPHDPTPSPSKTSPHVPTPALHASEEVSRATDPEEFSEHDEENDPVVHSFGPFGDNILSRFQSFQPASPEQARKPLSASTNPAAHSPRKTSPVKNHVINQLAFSRVHSLPLSTIHSNLPAELRGAVAKTSDAENNAALTAADLQSILDDIPCVGEISREGKDAAGKLLESEFYYVPEMDTDVNRRDTVTQSLGKTSIRAARKQHKQYYWKRPRN
ncbi:hypothetical protein BDY17DRAFT_303872 [Neohortaea acidophila]|uniref:FHA domain-containing protein n=1 Tax=Neohortaea acidophila TaxID=245834 RepID=A0A6A6PHG9_9PEZI|nr:uncharacterized protein BDY17DRAFT_303872 [Neohortaea acidophila]KAF2479440.1 hypothetical protein BDY17DRAFT_303872 [Neohortaea acidophila]